MNILRIIIFRVEKYVTIGVKPSSINNDQKYYVYFISDY